jgi:hypothetical protein
MSSLLLTTSARLKIARRAARHAAQLPGARCRADQSSHARRVERLIAEAP